MLTQPNLKFSGDSIGYVILKAAQYNQFEIVRDALKTKPQTITLFYSIDNSAIKKTFFDRAYGFNALHFAMYHNNLEMLRSLLEAKFSPNNRWNGRTKENPTIGPTSLEVALQEYDNATRNMAFIDSLLEYKADASLVSDEVYNRAAEQKKWPPVLKLLSGEFRPKEALLNQLAKIARTQLDFEVFEQLFKLGASPFETPADSLPVIDTAIMEKKYNLVNALATRYHQNNFLEIIKKLVGVNDVDGIKVLIHGIKEKHSINELLLYTAKQQKWDAVDYLIAQIGKNASPKTQQEVLYLGLINKQRPLILKLNKMGIKQSDALQFALRDKNIFALSQVLEIKDEGDLIFPKLQNADKANNIPAKNKIWFKGTRQTLEYHYHQLEPIQDNELLQMAHQNHWIDISRLLFYMPKIFWEKRQEMLMNICILAFKQKINFKIKNILINTITDKQKLLDLFLKEMTESELTFVLPILRTSYNFVVITPQIIEIAKTGHWEVVFELIKLGYYSENVFNTLSNLAIEQNHFNAMQMLKKKLDPFYKGPLQLSPIEKAIVSKNDTALGIFLQGVKVLHEESNESQKNNFSHVELKEEIPQVPRKKLSPLLCLAFEGRNKSACKLLLEHGANPGAISDAFFKKAAGDKQWELLEIWFSEVHNHCFKNRDHLLKELIELATCDKQLLSVKLLLRTVSALFLKQDYAQNILELFLDKIDPDLLSTFLNILAENGFIAETKKILEMGREGKWEIVFALLELGRYEAQTFKTLLELAIDQNNIDIIKKLSEKAKSIFREGFDFPFEKAILNKNDPALAIFLQDVTLSDKEAKNENSSFKEQKREMISPNANEKIPLLLCLAFEERNSFACKMLLEHGDSPRAISDELFTTAAQIKHWEFLEIWFSKPYRNSLENRYLLLNVLLRLATQDIKIDFIKLLIELGADPYYKPDNAQSIFQNIVTVKNNEILQIFLNSNFNRESKGEELAPHPAIAEELSLALKTSFLNENCEAIKLLATSGANCQLITKEDIQQAFHLKRWNSLLTLQSSFPKLNLAENIDSVNRSQDKFFREINATIFNKQIKLLSNPHPQSELELQRLQQELLALEKFEKKVQPKIRKIQAQGGYPLSFFLQWAFERNKPEVIRGLLKHAPSLLSLLSIDKTFLAAAKRNEWQSIRMFLNHSKFKLKPSTYHSLRKIAAAQNKKHELQMGFNSHTTHLPETLQGIQASQDAQKVFVEWFLLIYAALYKQTPLSRLNSCLRWTEDRGITLENIFDHVWRPRSWFQTPDNRTRLALKITAEFQSGLNDKMTQQSALSFFNRIDEVARNSSFFGRNNFISKRKPLVFNDIKNKADANPNSAMGKMFLKMKFSE